MFVPGKPFQPGLMFVDMARSLPYRRAPERFCTQVGSCLIYKHYTKLEGVAGDKHSLIIVVKSFISLDPGLMFVGKARSLPYR